MGGCWCQGEAGQALVKPIARLAGTVTPMIMGETSALSGAIVWANETCRNPRGTIT